MVAVKAVYSNIAHQHSLAFPCLAFETHAEFLPNQAVTAVGTNHVSGANLLGRTGMDQRGVHAITILLKADQLGSEFYASTVFGESIAQDLFTRHWGMIKGLA